MVSTRRGLKKQSQTEEVEGGAGKGLWEVWSPTVPVPCPVFDVQNALVVPDLTPEEYTQLSRRHTHRHEGNGVERDDSDSLELLLMDSLQDEPAVCAHGGKEKETQPQQQEEIQMYKVDAHNQEQEQVQHSGVNCIQKDQSIYLALESIGFDSWKHFVDTILYSMEDGDGKKKRKKKKEPCKVTLSDVLNGNSPYYHPRFSRAYQKIRKNLRHDAIHVRDVQTLQYHSALALSWSDLTAEEHSWYLMHQHQQLSGAEARRFNQLKRRIEKEKIKYMEEVKAHAEQHASRYEHMTERQNAQLFADDERRRVRIHSLFPQSPLKRVDCIQTVSPLVSEPLENARFEFVSVLHREGRPLEMKTLEQGYSLPGDKHYLPAVATLNHQSKEIYKKKEPVEIHEDEIIKKILKTHKGVVIVATGGAFRALIAADCLGYRARELEIPITVDDTVWYLGKPLMEKTMMAREKQARVQKYAVLSAAAEESIHKRQAVYSLWKHVSTGVLCIVRSHGTHMCSGVPSALVTKPEYLPLPDREDYTMEEVARWSAALCLEHPSGTRHMQVAHVCIPRGKILSWSTLQLDQIQHMYPAMKHLVHQTSQGGMEFTSTTLASLVSYARGVGKDIRHQNILAKAYTSGCVWDMYSCAGEAQDTVVYDVHAAHHTSTSTDVLSSPWVPPIWRPYSDAIAQVPYTFPPYCVENASADVGIPKRRRVRKGPWRGDLDNPNSSSIHPQPPVTESNNYMEQYLQELE